MESKELKTPEKKRNAYKKWRAANLEKDREYQREWKHNNREKCNIYQTTHYAKPEMKDRRAKYTRAWKLQKNYGLTVEDYDIMVESQESKCAICELHLDELDTQFLYVDHCHETGEVRGLLCRKCNTGIGDFCDDIDLLTKAIGYLNGRKPI